MLYVPLLVLVVCMSMLASVQAQETLVDNGDFTDGVIGVEGWNVWSNPEKSPVKATLDPAGQGEGNAALKLSTGEVEGRGAAVYTLGKASGTLTVSGNMKVDASEISECMIAIRTWANGLQQSFTPVFSGKNDGSWIRFASPVEIPEGADKVDLVLTFSGMGSVWLDDLEVE